MSLSSLFTTETVIYSIPGNHDKKCHLFIKVLSFLFIKDTEKIKSMKMPAG